MDSGKKAGQKGSVHHSKPAPRADAEQTHSRSSIEPHEGERVQALKQGEVKKTEHVKSGKK